MKNLKLALFALIPLVGLACGVNNSKSTVNDVVLEGRDAEIVSNLDYNRVSIKDRVSILSASNTTDFAGGTGTASDPYLIANETHFLNMLSNEYARTDKHFKLISHIIITSENLASCSWFDGHLTGYIGNNQNNPGYSVTASLSSFPSGYIISDLCNASFEGIIFNLENISLAIYDGWNFNGGAYGPGSSTTLNDLVFAGIYEKAANQNSNNEGPIFAQSCSAYLTMTDIVVETSINIENPSSYNGAIVGGYISNPTWLVNSNDNKVIIENCSYTNGTFNGSNVAVLFGNSTVLQNKERRNWQIKNNTFSGEMYGTNRANLICALLDDLSGFDSMKDGENELVTNTGGYISSSVLTLNNPTKVGNKRTIAASEFINQNVSTLRISYSTYLYGFTQNNDEAGTFFYTHLEEIDVTGETDVVILDKKFVYVENQDQGEDYIKLDLDAIDYGSWLPAGGFARLVGLEDNPASTEKSGATIYLLGLDNNGFAKGGYKLQ